MKQDRRSCGALSAQTLLLGAGLWLGSVGLAQSAIVLDFDQDTYFVAPGQSFEVKVVLDADGGSPGLQALPNGLFSYGVKVEFDPAAVSLTDVSSIQVPAALNFNGFSSGANKQTAQGFAGVKGNIDQNLFQPYGGTLLATFQLKDLGGGAPYRLDLQIFRTLGASEQVFLDGAGTVLDGNILRFSAQVTAVPEPGVGAMLASGLALLGLLGWLRRPPPPEPRRHVTTIASQAM